MVILQKIFCDLKCSFWIDNCWLTKVKMQVQLWLYFYNFLGCFSVHDLFDEECDICFHHLFSYTLHFCVHRCSVIPGLYKHTISPMLPFNLSHPWVLICCFSHKKCIFFESLQIWQTFMRKSLPKIMKKLEIRKVFLRGLGTLQARNSLFCPNFCKI